MSLILHWMHSIYFIIFDYRVKFLCIQKRVPLKQSSTGIIFECHLLIEADIDGDDTYELDTGTMA